MMAKIGNLIVNCTVKRAFWVTPFLKICGALARIGVPLSVDFIVRVSMLGIKTHVALLGKA